jgi:hypothetical protein
MRGSNDGVGGCGGLGVGGGNGGVGGGHGGGVGGGHGGGVGGELLQQAVVVASQLREKEGG